MKRIILSCWIIGCCCLFFSNNVLAQLLPPASSCGYTVVPATVPATTVVCINGTLDLPDDPGTTAPNYAYVITDPNNLIDPDGVPGSGDEEESIVGTVEETAPGTYVIDPVALGLVEGQSYCVTGFGFDLANINTIIQGVYVSAFCTFAVACVDNGDPSDDFCQACADGPPAPASFTTLQELFDFAAAVSGSADVSIESVLGIIELIEGLTAALAVPAPCYSISGLQEYCVDVVPASDAACVEDVCPTVLVDFNDPSTLPNLPSGVCVGDMIDLCFITDCSDCDLTAVDFQYTVAGAADPGFTPVQTDSVVCFQTTVPAGTGDPCAAYDLAITIVSVNTNDPQCTTGNVGYDIQNSPLGTLVGENINDVIPFLAFADANPIVVTVYPNLEVAVTGPDCDGNGGMAQLLAGTTECAVTMGTGGMTNVCPDQNGTAGELLWDFTANVDSAICITGAPLVGGIIADCIVPCCLDCSDVTCTTTMPCDDNDCSTENDEMVILTIDGSVCTVCAGTPVTPPTCNTTEVCDGAGGVTTEVYNPANCMCEVMVVDPPVCDDTVVCDGNGNLTSEQYNPATCQCEAVAVPQVPCDDGDCTNGVETYDLMTCQCLPGTPPVDPGCDDGDCTNGVETWDGCACVAGTPPVDPGCDDGDCSNGVETWDGCACVAGTPGEIPVCDDGDCSNGLETYDAANCQCVAGTPPVDPGCDDGDCTNGLEMWDGCECVAGTPNMDPGCDDGDCSNGVETWDGCACVAGTPPVDPGCDDGDCSNGVETWDGCACVAGTPPVDPGCDDGDCNTSDMYDAASCQCVFTPIPEPSCDDSDCTTDDSYDAASCTCINTPVAPPVCNTDPCAGDIETYDASTCTCVVSEAQVFGCTDALAVNFDATANCDDASCVYTSVEITDPCACGNPANVDLAPADGIIDFVIDTITITSTPGETWTLSSNTPAASGSSAVLSDGATSAVGTVAVETTPGQYVLVVYYPANGSGFGTLVFTEAGGTMIDITKADGFGCNCNPMAGCNPFFDAGPIEINRVCAGNALYVVDPNDPSGIAAYPADQYTTFEWFDAAGMPVATTIGHAYFSPSVVGTYTVQVTDINSCAQFNLTATGAPYAVTEIIDCTGCGDE